MRKAALAQLSLEIDSVSVGLKLNG